MFNVHVRTLIPEYVLIQFITKLLLSIYCPWYNSKNPSQLLKAYILENVLGKYIIYITLQASNL